MSKKQLFSFFRYNPSVYDSLFEFIFSFQVTFFSLLNSNSLQIFKTKQKLIFSVYLFSSMNLLAQCFQFYTFFFNLLIYFIFSVHVFSSMYFFSVQQISFQIFHYFI